MGVKDKTLEAAEELFASKGYDQTSIQDIIDHAGVSKGGLYHHFDSKEGILDALLLDFARKLRSNFENAIKHNKQNMTIHSVLEEYSSSKLQLPKHLQELYLKFLFNPREIIIREKFLFYIREELVVPFTEMIELLTDQQHPKEFAYLLLGLTEISTRLPIVLVQNSDFSTNFGQLLQMTLDKLVE